mgnify:CR=1 FL=1
MCMENLPIVLIIVLGGGGFAYWMYSKQDKTPVGLTTTKTIEGNQVIGKNGEDEYGISAVLGTFRESDSTLPISSEDESRPLLVISKNGEPIDAEVVDKAEPESLALAEMMLSVAEKYDLDSKDDFQEAVDSLKAQEDGAQEAESIFGPTITLQSHFVW